MFTDSQRIAWMARGLKIVLLGVLGKVTNPETAATGHGQPRVHPGCTLPGSGCVDPEPGDSRHVLALATLVHEVVENPGADLVSLSEKIDTTSAATNRRGPMAGQGYRWHFQPRT